MLKVLCAKQISNTDMFGYPNIQSMLEAAKRHPNIRPCPEHRGWVEKRWCHKCEFCKGIEEINDENE